MEAVASELRGMDAAYERCVKKAVIYLVKKRFGWPFFWFCFLWPFKENEHADRAESKDGISLNALTSADEL